MARGRVHVTGGRLAERAATGQRAVGHAESSGRAPADNTYMSTTAATALDGDRLLGELTIRGVTAMRSAAALVPLVAWPRGGHDPQRLPGRP